MFRRGLPLQLAIIVVCQMAFILFGTIDQVDFGVMPLLNLRVGYDQGVFSGIVGNKDFLKTMNSG